VTAVSVRQLRKGEGAVVQKGYDVHVDTAQMAVGCLSRVTVSFVSSEKCPAHCGDYSFTGMIAGGMDA
jgi:hypothetical protein